MWSWKHSGDDSTTAIYFTSVMYSRHVHDHLKSLLLLFILYFCNFCQNQMWTLLAVLQT